MRQTLAMIGGWPEWSIMDDNKSNKSNIKSTTTNTSTRSKSKSKSKSSGRKSRSKRKAR